MRKVTTLGRSYLAPVFVALALLGSARGDDKPAAPELATFEPTDKSFTIRYPAGWVPRLDRNKVITVAFANPANQFEAVTVGPVAVEPGTALEKWAETARATFKGRNANFKPIDDGVRVVADRRVWRMVFDVAGQGGAKFRFIYYLIPAAPKNFAVTVVAAPDQYERWLPLSEKIVASLKPADAK